MFLRPLIPALLTVALPAAETITEPVDLEMVRRNGFFGYTEAQFQQCFNRPLVLTLDRTGLDRSLLQAPPAPGIHPRVLFNPEDVAGIRERLKSTKAGQAVWAQINAHLAKQLGPQGDLRATYDALADGTATDLDPAKVKLTGFIALYEAFRCLMEEDQAGGSRCAAALVGLAKAAETNVASARAKAKTPEDARDWRAQAQGPTYEGTLGLTYDFAHGFMTPTQRDQVRSAIVACYAGMTSIGQETLFHLNANTSNWISWGARLLYLTAATEGEPGSDPAVHTAAMRSMTAFIGSFYDNGESYEGWGKQFIFMEHLAILAKRGKDVVAADKLRNVLHRYFLAAMNPWGGGFSFYDSLAGTDIPYSRNCDLLMYRRFFPQDPIAEFLYRNQIKGDYANLTPGNRVNTSHPFSVTDALCSAIYACDFDDAQDWNASQQRAVQGKPLSLFGEDTNNLITRSDWSKDAVAVHYLNKAVMGGHRYCDRSHVSLLADGRVWGSYHKMRQIHEQYLPKGRSVVMCDEEGPDIPPAKCVWYDDQPLATGIASDLRAPWEFKNEYLWPNKAKDGVRFPLSLNHFRLHPSPLPGMDLPMDELPSWFHSRKPKTEPYPGNPFDGYPWTKRPAIAFAYRTVVLVRGAHPYVLMADDLKRDDAEHTYTWNLTVPSDVILASAVRTGDDTQPAADVLLGEKSPAEGATARHLLIRVLQAPQLDATTPARLEVLNLVNTGQKTTMDVPKVIIPSRTAELRLRTLLFPHRAGAPLPTTTWSTDRRTATITWPDQTDTVIFTTGKDQRTRVALRRGTATLLEETR